MEMRTCPKCLKVKAKSDCRPNGNQCNACYAIYAKARHERLKADPEYTAKRKAYRIKIGDKAKEAARVWRLNNLEKSRSSVKAWREANREYSRAYMRARMLRVEYGLTQEQYDQMWDACEGKCTICRKPCFKALSIDHDHTTGKVRGLLCACCNRGLGYFMDSPENLRKAASYLECSPKKLAKIG